MKYPVLNLTKKLIKLQSVNANDAGCQNIIIDRLKKLQFNIEIFKFNNVTNLWAWRGKGKTLAFAGHTDVVCPGSFKNWKFLPFVPTIDNNMLYGVGVADMKGALASMVIAVENFIMNNPNHSNRIAFIITSGEETNCINGTKKIIEILKQRHEIIDYCIIGEPTSKFKIGDTIKNGRRGSLTANIEIFGKQGHVAYLNILHNPIYQTTFFLKELVDLKWDNGNSYFSPTTMQITYINSGYTEYSNVVPNKLTLSINFRFNTKLTKNIISKKVDFLLNKYKLKYKIYWTLYGSPFITKIGKLGESIIKSIKFYQNMKPNIETSGGTSDGRFIRDICDEIIEIGHINKTIHQPNECIHINDLITLSNIYQRVIENLFI
ncbi:MAG: succinyl-diaminopimelate desuccinylase [Enterobacterales bacterium]